MVWVPTILLEGSSLQDQSDIFDQGTPAPLIPFFTGHTEQAVEVLLTSHKRVVSQQNLKACSMGIVVLVTMSKTGS